MGVKIVKIQEMGPAGPWRGMGVGRDWCGREPRLAYVIQGTDLTTPVPAEEIGWILNGDRPTSVFVDRQGNVYVADQSNNRVQKWAPGASSGVTVAGLSGELNGPTDVFIDGQGALYVSSQYSNVVYKYPPRSTTGTVVGMQLPDNGPAAEGGKGDRCSCRMIF